ncbi:MAG: response regulator [Pseudomonadota bacterium]|nr:response regulator [Pseudomonadota bacterium]
MDDKQKQVIMAVEDNEDNRDLIVKILSHRGYDVIGVSNGSEALARLAEVAPDLVLMDINLPGMDGYEVTRRIRDNEVFAKVPIVALTAHAMHGDREKSLAAGCNAYVAKPIDVHTFPDIIAGLLSGEKR